MSKPPTEPVAKGRSRGRPRGFDLDVVLKAASERFRSRGYAATSLDDLVDATGLARPSLYAAFGDKRALYLAALARVSARAERGFDAIAAQQLGLRTLVECMLMFTIDGYLTGENGPSGCLAVSTASAESASDPQVRGALADFLAMEDRRIEELLAAAGSMHPAAHARIVAAVIHSLSVRARAGEPREALERIARDCAALVG
ncbi:MAG: helix-turn-helix domain-containing protein [Pseudomonadota bacterium]|uniref:TetR/AcrR family transcriptional regulator n=1 Tax=Sphingomonas sp. ERG5 TaxID=1381597 RepID=UPI00054B3026|nr:TetR/AcrR family transcriptional regulator [Sphingomonas sp. ERG5]